MGKISIVVYRALLPTPPNSVVNSQTLDARRWMPEAHVGLAAYQRTSVDALGAKSACTRTADEHDSGRPAYKLHVRRSLLDIPTRSHQAIRVSTSVQHGFTNRPSRHHQSILEFSDRPPYWLFWSLEPTPATAIFFATRYMPLLYGILGVINASSILSSGSCDALVKVANSLVWLHVLPIAAFSTTRVYALTKHRVFTSIIFTLSLVPLVLNFVSYAYDFSGIPSPIIKGCVSSLRMTQEEVMIHDRIPRELDPS
ncbi:hypothetical protein L226DRAFT_326313 [Lentinus tigrinus ALCF2SS1-7]|uniref:uncharacterized protein n=1 Tax=Lentinus tigrinus ALCF2SS1-7 TaxID=1328758 RepID=UPI001165F724|nr:hypothetical protein L226DRAFT_326313 [Lentinus tigrinus ALCF2SS1-7]